MDVEGFLAGIGRYKREKKECGKLWMGGDAVDAAQTLKGPAGICEWTDSSRAVRVVPDYLRAVGFDPRSTRHTRRPRAMLLIDSKDRANLILLIAIALAFHLSGDLLLSSFMTS